MEVRNGFGTEIEVGVARSSSESLGDRSTRLGQDRSQARSSGAAPAASPRPAAAPIRGLPRVGDGRFALLRAGG